MTTNHTGSCLCGAVSFEIHGPFEHFFLCHCHHCQKDTGSAHAANLFSSTAELVWRSGQDKVSSFTLPGTRHGKSFCSCCGSALPSLQMNGTLLVVPAGSLDTPPGLRPNAHLFMNSKADWDHALENLPKLPTLPE